MADEGGRETGKQASEGQVPAKVDKPEVGAVESAMSKSLIDKSDPDNSFQAILDKTPQKSDDTKNIEGIMGDNPMTIGEKKSTENINQMGASEPGGDDQGYDEHGLAKNGLQDSGENGPKIIKMGEQARVSGEQAAPVREVSDQLAAYREKANAGLKVGGAEPGQSQADKQDRRGQIRPARAVLKAAK